MHSKTKQEFDIMERLKVVETANDIIQHCYFIWGKPRIQWEEEYMDSIEARFELMTRDLDKLGELPLTFNPLSIDERIKYHDSVMAICNKYLEKIRKNKATSKDPYLRNLHANNDINLLYFVDLGFITTALNDMSMGIINSEKVRSEEITIEELHQNAVEKVRKWQGYITRRENMPDKRPREVADGVWSILEIVQPLTDLQGYSIYERICIGHPRGWEKLYQRKRLSVQYAKNVRERWRRGVEYSGSAGRGVGGTDWWDYLCYPKQLLILARPEVLRLLIGKPVEDKSETQRQNLSYIV